MGEERLSLQVNFAVVPPAAIALSCGYIRMLEAEMDSGGAVTLEPTDAGTGFESEASDSDGGDNIRCPICGWTPSKEDRWACSCGHIWNTFDTGGVCPACLLKWAYTCCLKCQLWSPHSDWYKNK
jgi:hypothetical protein